MALDNPSSLRIGTVVLTVHDLDRVGRFYREVVGLRELGRDGDILRLGTGTTVLIELRRDAQARFRSPRDAGLFHTAFLLPSRADLGRWTRHAARERFPIEGVADHGVSEAIYLSDPEGNGIEIYSDRPRDTWAWSGGTIAMRTDPLDTDALMRDAGPTAWDGVPEGSTVGHVHLQVGAIAPAEAFYEGVLGVPLTARYPGGQLLRVRPLPPPFRGQHLEQPQRRPADRTRDRARGCRHRRRGCRNARRDRAPRHRGRRRCRAARIGPFLA